MQPTVISTTKRQLPRKKQTKKLIPRAVGYLVISPPPFPPTAAVCLPDTIPPSVRNAAVVTPVGQVRLGETVTLTCNVPGKPSFTKSRHCVYYQGQYQLVGADYECGRKYRPQT